MATIWRWSTTVNTAVPTDPPIVRMMLIIVVARGTWARSSVEYAAAIAGIIVIPSPMPRTHSATPSTPYAVSASAA